MARSSQEKVVRSRAHSRYADASVWSVSVLVVLCGLVAYANALRVPFHFDDEIAVVRNAQIRELWPLTTSLSPPRRGEPVAGRPLVNFSLAVNYAADGLNPRGYHAVNVVFHLVCGLLLAAIVRRTSNSPALPNWLQRHGRFVALATALIWVLHPLNTGAATYVSGRTESLMGLFYLLTLYCGIRSATARRRGIWTAGSVAACALGMASKESMVTAPLLVVLCHRAFVFSSCERAFRHQRALYLGLASTWLILAALVFPGPRAESAGFQSGVGPWVYFLNQSVIVIHYLRFAFWPVNLVFDYGEPIAIGLATAAPYLAALLALVAATIVAWLIHPPAGFPAVWFFLTLAPTSSLIPIATEVAADRRMYLPLAGLVVLMVALGCRLAMWATDALDKRGLPSVIARVATAAVIVVVCGALTVSTRRRNEEYASPLTLWRTVVDRWPSPRAHRNLATQMKAAGYRGEVLHHLRMAVDAHPEVRHALGAELLEQGYPGEAIRELTAFIESRPADSEVNAARLLVGQALISEGRQNEAVEVFRAVVESEATSSVGRLALADALHAQGRLEEARREYEQYLTRAPRNANAWSSLGVVQLKTERVDEAIASLRQALALDGRRAELHRNLSGALLAKEDVSGALRHARQALALEPNDAGAHYLLGVAATIEGNNGTAIAHFTECLALDPGNTDARARLQQLTRAAP